MRSRTLKIFFTFLSVFLSLALFASCSGGVKNSTDEGGSVGKDGLTLIVNPTRKIVYTVNAVIETGDFTDTVDKVNNALDSINALDTEKLLTYVEYSSWDGEQSLTLRLRIKTEHLQTFIDGFDTLGRIKSRTISSEDITARYSELAATISAYETEVEYIEGILATETDFYTRQQFLSRISQLNIDINYYKNQLAAYDESVEYSTVTLRIYGIGKAPARELYPTKLKKAFYGSLDAVAIFFKTALIVIVWILPFAALGGGVFAAVYFPTKHFKKKKKNTKDNDKNN